jgi:preprotein translocase subunit YajC
MGVTVRLRSAVLFVLTVLLGSAAFAQDAPATPPGQPAQAGPREGRGMGGGRGMGMGSGVMGTVTEVAADHLTIKNDTGEIWTVNYSVNTRIMKQPPRPAGSAPAGGATEGGQGRGMGMGGGPPAAIKASEIKVGDTITAGGEMNRDAKSVGAVGIMVIDPERAKQMREMQANFGKTWLMGRVTAINETTVTLEGGPGNASHTFIADENTTFRRRREPITLGDMQVGDNVRVEGALKAGKFVATTVSVMLSMAMGGPAPRQGATAPE